MNKITQIRDNFIKLESKIQSLISDAQSVHRTLTGGIVETAPTKDITVAGPTWDVMLIWQSKLETRLAQLQEVIDAVNADIRPEPHVPPNRPRNVPVPGMLIPVRMQTPLQMPQVDEAALDREAVKALEKENFNA